MLFRDIVPTEATPPRYNWTFGLSSAAAAPDAPTCWGPRKASCISVRTFRANAVGLVHTAMHVRTLGSILKQAGAPSTIDYLSLDVEGFEDAVLLADDLPAYRFRAVTVERPSSYVRRRLGAMGLHFAQRLGFDELWTHAVPGGKTEADAVYRPPPSGLPAPRSISDRSWQLAAHSTRPRVGHGRQATGRSKQV